METQPRLIPGRHRRVGLACASVLVVALTSAARGADTPAGARVYAERCASCHGKSGEGTLKEYPHPLAGDRSVGQLTRYVAESMPDDDPGSLTAAEAADVAAFIHQSFYSRTAQARNKPARVELSRLTVRQYRNVVADLVGSFRTPGARGEKHGLRGEYFNARNFRGDKRVLDRTDPTVAFDFGTAGPEKDKFEPHEFSIRWQGSVLATETGAYEFVVKTEHATRLYVNDAKKPLIDAWVKSGHETEYRASVVLLGGRSYPIRLDFSKAKQGVDDSKKSKKKPPEVKASVALLWKPPGRVDEVIPERNLSPERSPEVFVATAPFPPDDRSVGYERGTSISKAWDQATTAAAIETAAYVGSHVRELTGAPDGGPDREKALRAFARTFVERAFRRPLTDDDRARHVDRQFEKAGGAETAVKRVVLLALKSPRFLYRETGAGNDPYDVATRISFALWDSIPDAALLDAAAAGRLAGRDDVARQAERMLNDPRTRAKVREFLLQWLNVDQAPDLSKDPAAYPGFTPAVAADLRTSLELFLDDVVWGESSDFRQLLLADSTYLNGRLGSFYGGGVPPDAGFRKVPLDPNERAGVLAHPYLLAAFAYTASSSPIHRGVFVSRSLLGRALRPPPAAVAPLAPDLHPGLTTRDRVALQTRAETCQSCHGMINPLGFTLERFDAVGRFRKDEKGRPVDATGAYQTRSGGTATFDGARDLGAFLAGSDEAHAAFVEQLFHYLVKQPIRAFGAHTPANLRKSFAANDFHVRKLIVEVVRTSALTPPAGRP